MILEPINQQHLFGLHNYLLDFIKLYQNDKFPSKILLSGEEGLGKSTLAYHFVNYVLSINQDFQYDLKKFQINLNNKSYKLTINGSNPNLFLIDTVSEKKKLI